MNAPPALPASISEANAGYVRVKFVNLEIDKYYLAYAGLVGGVDRFEVYKVVGKTDTNVTLSAIPSNEEVTLPKGSIDASWGLGLYRSKSASTGGYRKTRKHRRAKRKATRRNRRNRRSTRK
jgi:hypothetical protein